MKLRCKQMISTLLVVIMLLGAMPETALAEGTSATQISSTSGVTVSTSNEFMLALGQKISPITVKGVISVGDQADASGRMRPVMIPEGTQIIGVPGSNLIFRSPMQLAGNNVTFSNIELNFSSSNALQGVAHREIYLAGHSLTLDGVKTYMKGNDGSLGDFGGTESELLPTVYGGGYPGTTVGDSASLTIRNSNEKTMFKAIYMGNDKSQDHEAYTGKASLIIDTKPVVREGVYTDKNVQAEIRILNNGGLGNVAAKTFIGNENTTLSLSGASMYGSVIEGIGTLELKDGTYVETLSSEFQDIVMRGNACLNLNQAGNVTVKGKFDSSDPDQDGKERTLLLDPEGSLTIQGDISGKTIFYTGVRNFPANTLISGKKYIIGRTNDTVSPGSEFALPANSIYDDRYILDYTNGAWITNMVNQPIEKVEIGRVEIVSAPSAIDLSKIIYDGLKDEVPTAAPVNIFWYDKKGNRLSNEVVWNNGFVDESLLIIKTEYWKKGNQDAKTDWGNSIVLEQSEVQEGLYYLGAQGNSKEGEYTLLFCSEPIDTLNLITVADVKAAVANKVKEELTIDFYRPSTGTSQTDLNDSSIQVEPIPNQKYTGQVIKPEVKIQQWTKLSPRNGLYR